MTALRHIHLRSWPAVTPPRFPSYALATAVQTELQQHLLRWKAERADASRDTSPPPPTLLTFTPAPTYTLGRRQTEPLSAAELARLQRPLRLRYLGRRDRSRGAQQAEEDWALAPTVTRAPRGGLATYHGPGQVVFWPVVDLRSPLHERALSVRDYACLLERTSIAALASLPASPGPSPSSPGSGGIRGFTTSNPGVWVRGSSVRPSFSSPAPALSLSGAVGEKGGEGEEVGEEHKIAALGVHLRRHVTGLGVAINVGMPTSRGDNSSDDDELTNPWARIDACGLGDKGVTSVAAELGLQIDDSAGATSAGGGNKVTHDIGLSLYDALTTAWSREFAARLGLDGVASGEAGLSLEGGREQDRRREWGPALGLSSLETVEDGYVTAERWTSSGGDGGLGGNGAEAVLT